MSNRIKMYCIDTDGDPLVELCEYCKFNCGYDIKEKRHKCQWSDPIKLVLCGDIYYCSRAEINKDFLESMDYPEKLDYMELEGVSHE
jgi:hypothetical protein